MLLNFLSKSDIIFCRCEKIKEMVYTNKRWSVHIAGLARLLFLCQHHFKKKCTGNNRCMRWMYMHINCKVNTFLGDSANTTTLQKHAVELNEALEQAILLIGTMPKFRFEMLPMDTVSSLFNKFHTYYCFFADMVFSSNKLMLPVYKSNLSSCKALYNTLKLRNSETSAKEVQEDILATISHTTRQLGRILYETEMRKPHYSEVNYARQQKELKLEELYKWGLRVPLDDVLVGNTLLDRRFVFRAEHDPLCVWIDVMNQHALLIISLIEKELASRIQATESIMLFGRVLEKGIMFAASRMETEGRVTFKAILSQWKSGDVTWADAINTLDAAVADMRVLDWDAGKCWEEERTKLVSAQPSALAAFVRGLGVVWKIMKSVKMIGINHAVTDSLSGCSNFELYAKISTSFHGQMGDTHCKRVYCVMKETAETFPSIKKRILEKSKGSRFLFQGVFVTHVIFRRNKELTYLTCPETLEIWGWKLVKIQERVRLFCDAAIITSACTDGEMQALSQYFISDFKGKKILPIFMPISHGSIDRAEYALKNRRGAFELQFTKLFTLYALHLISRKLPHEIRILQGMANKITVDLEKIIRADRGIHFRWYSNVISKVCEDLGE